MLSSKATYYARLLRTYLREPGRIRDEIANARFRRRVRTAAIEPLPKPAAGELPVVVSLTSYGPRIQRVDQVIRCIMLQTVRPHRVVLWLGEDADGLELPQGLRALEPAGLEVRRGVADLKSHKKYYFAMQEFSDCLLVTIDDDLMFPPDTIESLLAAHSVVPDCVVARRCHRIGVVGGQVVPYADWKLGFMEPVPTPRRSLVATTGAGTLYPPSTFGPLVADPDDIRRLAPMADDLWLKFMELTAGIGVAYAPNDLVLPQALPFSQQDGLMFENIMDGGNDAVMHRLMEHFCLTPSDLVDDDEAQASLADGEGRA